MPFTFQIGNHSCQISERHLRDIIDHKREHVFSTYEKFIDFFRNIFTSRSLISDYREIYNLLCQKKSIPILKGLSLQDHFRSEMKTVHDGAPFLDILNLLMPPDLKQ
ncbi:putative inner membrane protein [Salmonella enterica subsp. enterica serovar Paratyphi B var. L(+) tartrate +]|nr:hypothetical protein SEEPB962_21481 [Salmonella enterica subsp. enterica serovar Paratyphi B str. ATCC 51962]SBL17850.1 putative inner membrane protein [Salmonella enterica subsp. enterica serovar Java]